MPCYSSKRKQTAGGCQKGGKKTDERLCGGWVPQRED